MSAQGVSIAFDAEVRDPVERLVLIYLGDSVGFDGAATLKLDAMARLAVCSPQDASDAVARLLERGLLKPDGMLGDRVIFVGAAE